MIKTVHKDVWDNFVTLLPEKTPRGSAAIPANLKCHGEFDMGVWVPLDSFLEKLRNWMLENGQTSAYYFLLEYVKGEEESSFFEIDVSDLNEENLDDLNVGYRSALVGKDFDWLISSDEGKFYSVAGPVELFNAVS